MNRAYIESVIYLLFLPFFFIFLGINFMLLLYSRMHYVGMSDQLLISTRTIISFLPFLFISFVQYSLFIYISISGEKKGQCYILCLGIWAFRFVRLVVGSPIRLILLL